MGALVLVRELDGATAADAVRQELAKLGDIITSGQKSGRYEVRMVSGDVEPGEGVAFLTEKLDAACPGWRDQIEFRGP
jgi:hypothetical protein